MKDNYIENMLKYIMKDFGEKNRIFVSEKDFQLELAWAIKEKANEDGKKNVYVKLEYCPTNVEVEYSILNDNEDEANNENTKNTKNTKMYIDILVIYDKKWYPIELKYKTKEIRNKKKPEEYLRLDEFKEEIRLTNQYAQDQGRCKFLFDVKRLEILRGKREKEKEEFGKGFAILLTNDMSYFSDKNNIKDNLKDKDFRLWNLRKLKGTYKWNNAKKGTVGSCPFTFEIKTDCQLEEKEYTDLNAKEDKYTNAKFKYFMVEVGKED